MQTTRSSSGYLITALLLLLLVLYIFVSIPLQALGVLSREVDDLFVALIGVVSIAIARQKGIWLVVLVACFGIRLLRIFIVLPAGLFLTSAPIFTFGITAILAAQVFSTTRVTGQTILGAIVVYLNLSVGFTGVYILGSRFLPTPFTNL